MTGPAAALITGGSGRGGGSGAAGRRAGCLGVAGLAQRYVPHSGLAHTEAGWAADRRCRLCGSRAVALTCAVSGRAGRFVVMTCCATTCDRPTRSTHESSSTRSEREGGGRRHRHRHHTVSLCATHPPHHRHSLSHLTHRDFVMHRRPIGALSPIISYPPNLCTSRPRNTSLLNGEHTRTRRSQDARRERTH